MLYWISQNISPFRNASLKTEMFSSLQLASHRPRCLILIVPASRTHLSLLLGVAMRDQGFTIPVHLNQRPPGRIVKRENRLMFADVVSALVF
jgi:hypothetical protein